MDSDELDVDADADGDDLGPIDEIEYEESDDVDTALEVELLLGRMEATRYSEA
jgi:hypothetical protein